MNGNEKITGAHRGDEPSVETAQAPRVESGFESFGQIPDGMRVHAGVRPKDNTHIAGTSTVGHVGNARQGNQRTSIPQAVGTVENVVVLRMPAAWYSILLQTLDQAQYVSTPWLRTANIRALQEMIIQQGGGTVANECPPPPPNVKVDSLTRTSRKKFLGIF
jgi:hypothetical protein